MITFPQIQIRQQYAKIGIDADHAVVEQRQPKPTYEMKYVKPELRIEQPLGDLSIDQTKAWGAYGRDGALASSNRIYDQLQGVYLQNLARKVEQGNRLADIPSATSAIAENAKELFLTFPELNYHGAASYDNVDIRYSPRKPVIEATDGRVEVNVRVNPPELTFHRGKLDIYMMKHASVEITPPLIDVRL